MCALSKRVNLPANEVTGEKEKASAQAATRASPSTFFIIFSYTIGRPQRNPNCLLEQTVPKKMEV